MDIEVQASGSEHIRKYSVRGESFLSARSTCIEHTDRPDLAVLTVSQLTASGPHELRQIESRLSSEVRNIIIDLRATADTDLHNAHIFADALTEEASLGAVKSRTGTLQIRTEPGRLFRNRRVILLISQRTSPNTACLHRACLPPASSFVWIRSVSRRRSESGTGSSPVAPERRLYCSSPAGSGNHRTQQQSWQYCSGNRRLLVPVPEPN